MKMEDIGYSTVQVLLRLNQVHLQPCIDLLCGWKPSGETRTLVPLSNELHQHVNIRLVQWNKGPFFVTLMSGFIWNKAVIGPHRSAAAAPSLRFIIKHRAGADHPSIAIPHRQSRRWASLRFACPTFTGPCEAASGLIWVTSDLHQPNRIRTSAVLRMRLSAPSSALIKRKIETSFTFIDRSHTFLVEITKQN